MDVQEGQLRAGMNPMQPGFGAEAPSSYGMLDSQALELNPALQAAAPAGPLEPLPEVPEGASTSPAAAAATMAVEAAESATAAAVAGRGGGAPDDADIDEPAATVSSIAAAVLAKIDAGGAAGSTAGGGSGTDGTCVRVVTQQGSWHKFYEEVGGLLLAVSGQPKSALHVPSSSHGGSDRMTEAAGAMVGSVGGVHSSAGSASGSDGKQGLGINSQLSVTPEAAADVIRVIELALQSSKEGRTLLFDA